MNNGVKNYEVWYGSIAPIASSLLDDDLFYDDMGSTIEFSNASGNKSKKKSTRKPLFRQGILKDALGSVTRNQNIRAKAKLEEAQAQKYAAKSLAKQPAPSPIVRKTTVKSAPLEKKNNTVLYIGIGVGVLALGTGIFFLLKKKK